MPKKAKTTKTTKSLKDLTVKPKTAAGVKGGMSRIKTLA